MNDCVIIPGFGGFVTNYKPASQKQSKFSPPTKTVSFNKKLNFNDGLLINHIAMKEGFGYVESRRKIDLLVQEMNYRLTDGENIQIPGIGTLRYDEHEHLIFIPNLEDNLNLDSFGLASFSYETLFQRKRISQLSNQKRVDASEAVFSQRKLKRVLIAVPLLLALAIIPMKNGEYNLQKSDMSMVTEMMEAKETVSEPVETMITEEAPIVDEEIIAAPLVEYNYYVITGSFRNDTNASNFVKQMQADGYEAKNIGIINGLNYISIGNYETLNEAKTMRDQYEQSSSGSGVWIYVKK